MDYRKPDGEIVIESFDDIGQLLKRKKALEARGCEVTRVYYKDDAKYPAHQGRREAERRVNQLLAAKKKATPVSS